MTAFALGGFSSILSFFQAGRANKAGQAAASSAMSAGAVQAGQSRDAAQIQKLKRITAERQIAGQLAVASAENGVGMGGTYADLARSNAYAASLDTTLIDMNAHAESAAIQTRAQAEARQYANRHVNPFLAAFSGGMSGLQSGLAIGGAIDGMFEPSDNLRVIQDANSAGDGPAYSVNREYA